ncbi:MAG: hypothetical protein JWP02_968 [Acidimicrobiales bacterium]|nr:hypothetical protein [Acidimicrobiales bacterium]
MTVVVLCSASLLLAAACGSGGSKGETFATTPTTTSAPAGTAPPTSSAPAAADRAAAERMSALLEQSNSSRGQVAAAVQGAAACSLDPRQASATFGAAATARQSVLTSAAAVDVTGLPEGPQLKGLLEQALQPSVEADQDFQTWAQQLTASGCTPGRTTQNSEFAAANDASGRATAGKTAFVGAWNPVAARYGLRQWAAGDI